MNIHMCVWVFVCVCVRTCLSIFVNKQYTQRRKGKKAYNTCDVRMNGICQCEHQRIIVRMLQSGQIRGKVDEVRELYVFVFIPYGGCVWSCVSVSVWCVCIYVDY